MLTEWDKVPEFRLPSLQDKAEKAFVRTVKRLKFEKEANVGSLRAKFVTHQRKKVEMEIQFKKKWGVIMSESSFSDESESQQTKR